MFAVKSIGLAAAGVLFAAFSANAGPLLWTLTDAAGDVNSSVLFSDGTLLTGTFDFDADAPGDGNPLSLTNGSFTTTCSLGVGDCILPDESDWVINPINQVGAVDDGQGDGFVITQPGSAGCTGTGGNTNTGGGDLTNCYGISLFSVGDGPMTDSDASGATLVLDFTPFGVCDDSICDNYYTPPLGTSSGAFTIFPATMPVTGTPEPSTFILGGSILALGAFRKRKAR